MPSKSSRLNCFYSNLQQVQTQSAVSHRVSTFNPCDDLISIPHPVPHYHRRHDSCTPLSTQPFLKRKPETKRLRRVKNDVDPCKPRVAAMAEWLRRWTRNPMGSSRAGSNPARSGLQFFSFPARSDFVFFAPFLHKPVTIRAQLKLQISGLAWLGLSRTTALQADRGLDKLFTQFDLNLNTFFLLRSLRRRRSRGNARLLNCPVTCCF